MSDYRELLAELDALERVHAELVSIAARSDDRRRHDLIALRRRFSDQMAIVGRLADPIFARAGDSELHQPYRDHFSRMRSTAATHQANWPAVKIDEATDLYRRSAQGVTEACRQFQGWMREVIGRFDRAG